jgi:DNA-binding CsgD family transcriptional regulator
MAFSLGEHDLRGVLDVVDAVDHVDDGPVLPWPLLHELKGLIGCHSIAVSGQDEATLGEFAVQDLPAEPDIELSEEWWRAHYWDYLHCSYPQRTGDLRSVTMISDFYSDRQYHQTAMYAGFLRLSDVEHEIMVCLPAGPGRFLKVMFGRGRGTDFGERERAILALLRPHLYTAYVTSEHRHLGIRPLTARQEELMQYVAAGFSNQQIARRLGVSESTVRKHMENIFARLQVTSRTAAIGRAREPAF